MVSKNIERYIKEQGMTLQRELGSGLHGHAVLVDGFRVVKETKDPNEVLFALKQMQSSYFLPMVSISDIQSQGNTFIITQEYAAITPELKEQVDLLQRYYTEYSTPQYQSLHAPKDGSLTLSNFLAKNLLNKNQFDSLDDMGKNILSLFESLAKNDGAMEMNAHIHKMDARLDQLGLTADFKLVFFDLRDGSIDEVKAKVLVEQALGIEPAPEVAPEDTKEQYRPSDPRHQMSFL